MDIWVLMLCIEDWSVEGVYDSHEGAVKAARQWIADNTDDDEREGIEEMPDDEWWLDSGITLSVVKMKLEHVE